MDAMFYRNSDFNQELNTWNVESVTNMGSMFAYATSFNKPLNNWKPKSLIYANFMFGNSEKFNQDISSWSSYIGNLETTRSMFLCNNIEVCSFDRNMNSWFDETNKIADLESMFSHSSFNNGGVNINWILNKATQSGYAFSRSVLSVGVTLTIPMVTNAEDMFKGISHDKPDNIPYLSLIHI